MSEVGYCQRYCSYVHYCPYVQHNLNHSESRRLRWLLVVEMKAMDEMMANGQFLDKAAVDKVVVFRRWIYRRDRHFERVSFASANTFGNLGITIKAASATDCWCRRRLLLWLRLGGQWMRGRRISLRRRLMRWSGWIDWRNRSSGRLTFASENWLGCFRMKSPCDAYSTKPEEKGW